MVNYWAFQHLLKPFIRPFLFFFFTHVNAATVKLSLCCARTCWPNRDCEPLEPLYSPLWIASHCKIVFVTHKRWWRPALSFAVALSFFLFSFLFTCLESKASKHELFLLRTRRRKQCLFVESLYLEDPETIRGQFSRAPKLIAGLKNVSILKYWQTQKHTISHCLWIMELLPRGGTAVTC